MNYSKEEIAENLVRNGFFSLKDFTDYRIGAYMYILNLSEEELDHINDILLSLDNKDVSVGDPYYTLDDFALHAEYVQEVAPELHEKIMDGLAKLGITVEHGILTCFWDNNTKRIDKLPINKLSTGRLNFPVVFAKEVLDSDRKNTGNLYINTTENGKEIIYKIDWDLLSSDTSIGEFCTYFAIDDSTAEIIRHNPYGAVVLKLCDFNNELNFSVLVGGEPVITKDTKDIFYNSTLLWKIIFSKIVYKITGSSVFEFFDLDTADFFTPLNINKYKSAAGKELYTLHKYTFISLDEILRDWWDGIVDNIEYFWN